MLMRRWERAQQGDGQLVLIVGEPGIGKSRLIEEFHGRLRDTPHTWLEWSCSQLLQNTALHPIAELGRQRFGGAGVSAELGGLHHIYRAAAPQAVDCSWHIASAGGILHGENFQLGIPFFIFDFIPNLIYHVTIVLIAVQA